MTGLSLAPPFWFLVAVSRRVRQNETISAARRQENVGRRIRGSSTLSLSAAQAIDDLPRLGCHRLGVMTRSVLLGHRRLLRCYIADAHKSFFARTAAAHPSPPKVGKSLPPGKDPGVSGEARRMGYGEQVREARVFAATFRAIGLQVEAAAHTPSGRLRRPPSPARSWGRVGDVRDRTGRETALADLRQLEHERRP